LRKTFERLEYGGYDSAGVVVMNNELIMRKDAGRAADITARYNFNALQRVAGLTHTKWAIRVRPSQVNVHRTPTALKQ